MGYVINHCSICDAVIKVVVHPIELDNDIDYSELSKYAENHRLLIEKACHTCIECSSPQIVYYLRKMTKEEEWDRIKHMYPKEDKEDSVINDMKKEAEYWKSKYESCMNSKRIDDMLDELDEKYPDENLLYPTDLKDAIIGTMEFNCGCEGVIERIVLDKNKCIEIFMNDGMTEEDALEHFYYNTLGSYMQGVPAFVTLIDNE